MRSVFYTPVYAAVSRGFCAEEGLEVEVYTCAPGEKSTDLAAQGRADAVQSSPSGGLVSADRGETDFPLHFAQINRRDGFFLVARPERTQIQWMDLEGAELLPASFAAQPWLSLQYCLRRKGVDPGTIRLARYPGLLEAEEAFRQGRGDFVHLPQPYAERLLLQGAGRLAAAIGPEIGPVAFSSLAAHRDRVRGRDPILVRFARGFARAQQWVQHATPEDLAEALHPFFRDTDRTLLARAALRYRDQETWAIQPLISAQEFDVIREIFYAGGAIKARHAYEAIVDTEIARLVTAEGSRG
jgi:NitT/TauT family transport system substrate-binding protein